MQRYADIDITKRYRYLLGRRWDANLQQVTFVMLNPSKADENQDDPTLNKCIKFARYWNYGCLEVVNLFAYIATKPNELPQPQVDDPVGLENNSYIQSATNRAHLIIVAWGTSDYLQKKRGRETEVLSLISGQKTLYCLELTKKKFPRHPLYVKDITKPMIFPNYSIST